MTIDSQVFNSFVPVYSVSPEKPEDLRNFATEQLRIHANGINFREIGWYLDQETITGKNFIPGTSSPNDQTYRTIFRKVVPFGPLPNNTMISMPHGITFDANFTLIDFWATATDPVSFKGIPIPYSSVVAGMNVELDINQTSVMITTTANYSNYTRCNVFIEYLLEQ